MYDIDEHMNDIHSQIAFVYMILVYYGTYCLIITFKVMNIIQKKKKNSMHGSSLLWPILGVHSMKVHSQQQSLDGGGRNEVLKDGQKIYSAIIGGSNFKPLGGS